MKRLFILFIISCISCTQKQDLHKQDIKKQDDKLISQKAARMEQYKNQAISKGDDFIYGSYLEFAESSGMKYEQLSVSLVMNYKFDNKRSYYEIYRCMVELNNNFEHRAKYLANLNEIDKAFAISYLIKGAKKNDASCQIELEKIYRNGYGMEKDAKKSDSLYNILAKKDNFYARNRNTKYKVDEIGS